jgi:hypothetical protein
MRVDNPPASEPEFQPSIAREELLVAADGSGDYETIGDALREASTTTPLPARRRRVSPVYRIPPSPLSVA